MGLLTRRFSALPRWAVHRPDAAAIERLDGCSGSFDPAEDAANVFRISASGEVTQVAHFNADTFPNDLAFDAAGNVFLTEPFLGKV